jgi:hypothetical protein
VTPEREVVKSCLRLLALKGIFSWRQNTAGIFNPKSGKHYFHGLAGVPDILGILPGGRFLGVECKSAEGRQSESQAAFQAECETAGGLYCLVHSASELAEKLDEVRP